MKRAIVSIVCVAAMIAALFVPVFPAEQSAVTVIDDVNYNGDVYKDAEDGKSINDKSWSSSTNTIRQKWTPSRVFDNSHAVMYTDGTRKVAKITGKQWFDRDSGFQKEIKEDYGGAGKIRFSLTLKPGKVTGYMGTNMSYGSGFRPERDSDEEKKEWRCGEYPIESAPDAHIGGTAGYGWTFVPGQPTKLLAYVRTLGTKGADDKHELDAIVYEFDAGVDLTKDYHTYDIYIDAVYDDTAEGIGNNKGTVYFVFDGKLWCKLVLSKAKSLFDKTVKYDADDDDYFTTAVFYSPNGVEYQSINKDGKESGGKKAISAISWGANFSVSHEGDVLYVERVLTETFTEVPAAVEVTDDAKNVKVDTGKKIDVLDKQTAVFTNPNKNAGTSELPKLTDGVYAKAGGNCYFNTSWIKKADVEGAKSNYNASTLKTKSGGDITFNGVDNQKYLYSFEFKDLGKDTGGVKADSFALWINNNTYYADDEAWACQQFDCEFDILVSTDGGQTYQKAWSSVRYQEKANGRFPFVGANLLKSQGGNMKNGKYVFADGSVAQYRYISEKFNKAYEGVTNIVYATSVPRVQQKFIVPYSVTNDAGETYEETFFSYVCRISEFDVYDSSNAGGSSAATGDYSVYMIIALVAVATVALGGIVIVRRRRREN